jgi:copper chaperone NosL
MKIMVPLTVAVALLIACSSITPLPIRAGDTCFRCRRTISHTRLAAELVDENRRAFSYKTAGCLAKYLAENPGAEPVVFVTDYTSGKLIRASSALFVRSVIDERTGEHDFYAFQSRDEALAFAKESNSSVIDWLIVLQQARLTEANAGKRG